MAAALLCMAGAALAADEPAARVWSGAGTTANASDPANWVGNQVPQFEDRVVFGATAHDKDCHWDYDVDLSSITLTGWYHGKVSLGKSRVEVINNVRVSGGTLDLDHGTLEVLNLLYVHKEGTLQLDDGELRLGRKGFIVDEGGALLGTGNQPASMTSATGNYYPFVVAGKLDLANNAGTTVERSKGIVIYSAAHVEQAQDVNVKQVQAGAPGVKVFSKPPVTPVDLVGWTFDNSVTQKVATPNGQAAVNLVETPAAAGVAVSSPVAVGGGAAAQAAAVSTAPVVVDLSGLLVVASTDQVQSVGTPNVRGVAIKVDFLNQPDLQAALESYLGQPISETLRAGLVEAIANYARRHDRVVWVDVPPQEITGGVLQLVALNGKVGKIRVEGNRWFSSDLVSGQMREQAGDPVDPGQINEDLDWINQNPFRSVDLVYVKGSELGSTDLVLREKDEFPVRVYMGFEDSGTQQTGMDRVLAGFNWGNVFGEGGQFNYQYFADPTFQYMRANSASYIQPLPWRDILTVYGSYVNTQGDVPSPFNLKGFNDQASLRYEVPLPRSVSKTLDYTESLTAGFDYKAANNNLAFGGSSVYAETTNILQWNLGYSGSLKDPWGVTAARATAFYSPGNLMGNDNNAVYELARAGATADYAYANVQLNRTTGLPWDFSLENDWTGQVSDANLLPSEQLGFGGYDTIRGYDMRAVNADQGLILRNEIRTPPISPLSYFGLESMQDKFQFLAFFDYGMAADHTLLAGEAATTSLASVGPGVRYAVLSNLTIRADWGWQLLNINTFSPGSSRGDVGVVLSF